MAVELPDPANATGAAVVLYPGGGYERRTLRWTMLVPMLKQAGFVVFTVIYTIGNPRDPACPKALWDGTRAASLVQARLAEWGLDGRILLFGSSAGGHLASFVETNGMARMPPRPPTDAYDDVVPRIAAAVLISPITLMDDTFPGDAGVRRNFLGLNPKPALVNISDNVEWISPSTPSTFLFHCRNDPNVAPDNSIQFYWRLLSLRTANDQIDLAQCDLHALQATSIWLPVVRSYLDFVGLTSRATPSPSASPRPVTTKRPTSKRPPLGL